MFSLTRSVERSSSLFELLPESFSFELSNSVHRQDTLFKSCFFPSFNWFQFHCNKFKIFFNNEQKFPRSHVVLISSVLYFYRGTWPILDFSVFALTNLSLTLVLTVNSLKVLLVCLGTSAPKLKSSDKESNSWL